MQSKVKLETPVGAMRQIRLMTGMPRFAASIAYTDGFETPGLNAHFWSGTVAIWR